MKTVFLLLLLVSLVARSFGAVADVPVATAERYYRAAQDKDIDRLAQLFHPKSLNGHRRYIEIVLLKLEKTYGEHAVSAVVGSSKTELNELSDLDYFRQTMKTALELSEMDARPSRALPKVIGRISDGDVVYVLASHAYSIEESGRRFSMRSPESLAFKKDEEEWKVFSFPYATHVVRLYAIELAAAGKAIEGE